MEKGGIGKLEATRDLSNVEDQTSNSTSGEVEREYPGPVTLAFLVIALALTLFCMGVDTSIIVVAIPKITDRFNSLLDIGWYGSAYFLTTASLQLFFGKLYKLFSTKWVFLLSLSLFELGSLICAVAPSSTVFIIGRALAGIGVAGLYSGAVLILQYSVPLAKRPLYMGMVGSMFGVSAVAAPLLGGVFTDKLTWRWCFYINLPFGLLTATVIIFFFRPTIQPSMHTLPLTSKMKLLDFPGVTILVAAIVCLLLSLQFGGLKYQWSNWRIILMLTLFPILCAISAIMQSKQGEGATLPKHIVARRDVVACAFYSFCIGGAFFTVNYYLPIWFQAIKNASAMRSGIMSLPFMLGYVVATLSSGIAVTVGGYYTPWLILSSICSAIGGGLMIMLKVDTTTAFWIGAPMLFGIGIGLGQQLVLIAMQNIFDEDDVPIATAIQLLTSQLGGAIFVSISQTLFANRLTELLTQNLPQVPNIGIIILVSGALDLKKKISDINPAFLPIVLTSYDQAICRVMYMVATLGGLSLFGSLLVQWRSVKHEKNKGSAINA